MGWFLMDDSAGIYEPLLSGKMADETKNQLDVHTTSSESHALDAASADSGSFEKKAPWWSYFWVSEPSLTHHDNQGQLQLTARIGL